MATECTDDLAQFRRALNECHQAVQEAKNKWFQEKDVEAEKVGRQCGGASRICSIAGEVGYQTGWLPLMTKKATHLDQCITKFVNSNSDGLVTGYDIHVNAWKREHYR